MFEGGITQDSHKAGAGRPSFIWVLLVLSQSDIFQEILSFSTVDLFQLLGVLTILQILI